MAEYQLKISGVHYGANGDSVAGQKYTEEMHVRTREMLSWIDRERPIVVLSADPTNHIHKEAIMARAQSRMARSKESMPFLHSNRNQSQET